MLNLYKLEIFSAVVEAGSFSKAAERLYLTQSAISQHMQDLEASLGTRLFERKARGVSLTPAGEILRDYTRCILNLLAEAENAVTNVEQLSGGQIRVGATPGAGGYLLPDWMQAFRARYPRLVVSLTTDVTAKIVAGIMNRALDIGFIEGELAEDRGLESLILEEVSQWVVVGQHHAWYGQAAVPVAALAGQPFVMRPQHSQTRIWLDNLLGQHSITPDIAAELDSPEAIKQAVIAGMGISILPEYVIRRERELGVLHALAVTGATMQRTLKLVWDERRPFAPVTRAFLFHLTGQFPQLFQLVGLMDDPAQALSISGDSALDTCRSTMS